MSSNKEVTLRNLDDVLTELRELDEIPADLVELLDMAKAERIDKIEAIAYAIQTLKYWQEIREKESKRLAQLAKQDEIKIDWLKDYLKNSLEKQGETKVRTKSFDISIRKAGGVQALDCDLPLNQVPDDYLTFTPTLNKTLLREHLEESKLPLILKDNVRLREKGNYLSIK
jgi:hypothetical protein